MYFQIWKGGCNTKSYTLAISRNKKPEANFEVLTYLRLELESSPFQMK